MTRDLIDALPEFIAVEQDEIRNIAVVAISQRVKQVKLQIADTVLTYQLALAVADSRMADQALEQTKRLKQQLETLTEQWERLEYIPSLASSEHDDQ